jgi:uncharacterized protein
MDYPLVPTAFTQVQLDDDLWRPRLETNRSVTIPYAFARCEETGRIANFARAAGRAGGPHEGRFYNDSDVFKVVEGASYALHAHHDPDTEAYLDRLIELIDGAQEADGYLYTARTVDPSAVQADQEGSERWSNLRVSHELYNVGHLYDAAVAHHQATGKRTLLDVALRSADLIDAVFGPSRRRDVPGHQQIEMGLVKLYRVTGIERYLALAKFFLDERGRAHGRSLYHNFDDPGYMQDHLPVTAQRSAVGHAVRAMYLYCGMADVAALTGDEAYVRALDVLWDDVVRRKTYLTGGVGARHRGEAFGEAYELPNQTAYAETCAAIGSVMWNHRMFLLHGDAKYLDVLERTLYNGLVAGVALDGTTFFYANPLASDGAWNFNHGEGCTRSPWFECSCCPTNVVRFLASLPGYVYAATENELYVNLYVAGAGSVEVAGLRVGVDQRTRYPWSGAVELTLAPERAARFTLAVRIPGWVSAAPLPGDLYAYLSSPGAGEVTLRVNGRPVSIDVRQGFARVDRTWQRGDVVELDLPMSPRRVICHEAVSENRGRVAVERGPIVYCAEAIDNRGAALGLHLDDGAPLAAEHDPSLLGGISTVRAGDITLVPYYAWGHRGAGEMQVWLRRGPSAS